MSGPMMFRAEIMPYMIWGLIILIAGVFLILRSFFQHRERMAMIRAGMHPDGHQAAQETGEKPAATPVATKEAAWSDWAPPN